MGERINYLPHFNDDLGNRWDILQMNWCVDFGGRQCQIECQRNNDDGSYPVKHFVIYGLTGEFVQWDSGETADCNPDKNHFYKMVMDLFKLFGEEDIEK